MKLFAAMVLVALMFACSGNGTKNKSRTKSSEFNKGTYGYDLKFLKEHANTIELKSGDSRVIVSPEYQGRVFTSTSGGENGLSYGWINYNLISSGKNQKHINPVGGEERFWIGPEGGQFSIFFKKGDPFDHEHWQTPAFIDTEKYKLLKADDTEAEFTKSVKIKNYSDFQFEFDINRKIILLNNNGIKSELGIDIPENIKSVGYKTVNRLTNTGNKEWLKATGLLSVWLLGMYNPSDGVTIIVPYKTDAESDYIVKDDYFGKVPADRLVVKNGFIFFKGDGKKRCKIGVAPQRAMPFFGSYNADKKVLTIIKCSLPEGVTDYVNSAWELQDFPYKGDVINSYNDGPLADGTQLGPFYELEASSPALALKPGKAATYEQSTFHFTGDEDNLNSICKKIFNISLQEVKDVF